MRHSWRTIGVLCLNRLVTTSKIEFKFTRRRNREAPFQLAEAGFCLILKGWYDLRALRSNYDNFLDSANAHKLATGLGILLREFSASAVLSFFHFDMSDTEGDVLRRCPGHPGSRCPRRLIFSRGAVSLLFIHSQHRLACVSVGVQVAVGSGKFDMMVASNGADSFYGRQQQEPWIGTWTVGRACCKVVTRRTNQINQIQGRAGQGRVK